MMSKLAQYRDVVYLIVILVGGWFAYKAIKDLGGNVQQLFTINAQIKDDLARASTTSASKKELEALAKDLDLNIKAISKDLNKLDASLKAVGVVVASIPGHTQNNQGSTSTTPHDPPPQPAACRFCDVHGYTAELQKMDLYLGGAKGLNIGQVAFDASASKPWSYGFDDLRIEVKTAVGEQNKIPGLLVFYHEVVLKNVSLPEMKDKELNLGITYSEWKQVIDKTNRFYWWAPHLDLGLDFNLAFGETPFAFGASLGVSMMAYGNTKSDNMWRFIRVGAGLNFNEQFFLTLEPARYNVGKPIPLIDDLWFGIGALYNGSFGINFSIGTTL